MKEQSFIVTHRQLVEAMEQELREYFYDGVSPTLGQYAIDHIIGGVCQRVLGCPHAAMTVGLLTIETIRSLVDVRPIGKQEG